MRRNRHTLLLGAVMAAAAALAAATRADEQADLLAPKAFRAAVDKVLPSVVTIETYGTVAAPVSSRPATRPAVPGRPAMPGAPGGRPGGRGTPGGISKPGEGPTTGLIVSSDGLIITSTYNFLRNQPVITVVLHDKSQHVAKLLGRDDTRKLCLLKIDGVKDLPVAPTVSPKDLKIGQWAISVGFGYGGEEAAMSTGIVSATGRIGRRALQTDANLSPVNYGGPLIDIEGRVLGICVPLAPKGTDTASGTEWYDSGIGFAIPLHDAEGLIKRMAAGETIKQGYLGIRPAAEPRKEGGLPIDVVSPGSPAAEAGLKKGDVILSANDQPVNDTFSLQGVMNMLTPGETVTLVVLRGEEKLTLAIKLAAAPTIPVTASRPATSTASAPATSQAATAPAKAPPIEPLPPVEAH